MWQWSKRVLRLPAPAIGAMINSVLIVNAGLGVAVTSVFLGLEAVPQALTFDLLVNVPLIFMIGFAVGAGWGEDVIDTPKDRIRAFFFRNPPLWAAIAALLFPSGILPDFFTSIGSIIVVVFVPIGFFAVGVHMAAACERKIFRLPTALRAPIISSICFRMVLSPLLLFLISTPFFSLPRPYFIAAAMPSAMNSLVIAHAYGLHRGIAALTIVYSTTVAFLVLGGVFLLRLFSFI
jgi:predicted permease